MAAHTERRFADLKMINMNDPGELQKWCEVLGCTPEKLKAAIYRAGASVEAVKKVFWKVKRGSK